MHDILNYISPDGWYSLAFPNTWAYEVENDCTTFYKSDNGVGALQISAYETDIPQSPKENLIEYLEGKDINVKLEESVLRNDQQMAEAVIENGDSYTRVLFISKGNYLLFITYLCDTSDKTIEQEDVNTVLASIELAE